MARPPVRIALAAIIALAAPLVAGAAAPARAADDAFVIDVIIPLTGSGAFLGTTQQKMMQETEKVINQEGGVHGKPVRFVYHDDQTSPQVAVQLVGEVTANHPPLVLGSTISALCNAMTPLMQNGPVHYCFSPSVRPVPGGYTFASQIASRDQQHALMRYFQAKGWKRIALITTNDASGQDADRAISDTAKEPAFADMAIVEDTHFNATDVSITAQIARMAAAHPQVIISWATAAAGATVFRGLVQAGLDLPVASSASNMTYGQMIDYASFLPKQLFFGTSAWAAAGQKEINLAPDVLAEQKRYYAVIKAAGLHTDGGGDVGWDPPRLLVAALNKLPDGATAAQLHDYLEHVKGYGGIDGVYDFTRVPQRGLDISDALVVRWDAARKDWAPVSQLGGAPLGK